MSVKKAFIQSVDRSLQILELFSEAPSLSLIEITNHIGLAKTTTFGLLATLERRGFLEQDTETGRYRLGIRFMELASVSAGRTNIVYEAVRLLRPIAEMSGHNAHVTILDGMSVVYVGQVEPMSGAISIKTNIGARAPANCTSSGKAFLAHLSNERLKELLAENPLVGLTQQSKTNPDLLRAHLREVAAQGYAVDQEESISGVSGVGIVVCNRANQPILGISIAGLSIYFTEQTILKHAHELQKAADSLSVLLNLQIGPVE